MDTLRGLNLSSVLTQTENNMKVDPSTVSTLVKTFSELSKNEKILFLINIREYTSEDLDEQDNDKLTPQTHRLSRTSNWLQKTFIQDTQVALPKEEVYGLYKNEFNKSNDKPISTADFGKLMRQVFPDVKARRLGQRGQSKYCYANIRKRSDVEKPSLPVPLPQNELVSWAKNKFNIDFNDVSQVVGYLRTDQLVCSRKRRASCGTSPRVKKPPTRSASVSVLDHDTESMELGSYFENTSTNWPQLRSLLTEEYGSPTKKKRHSSSVQFEFIKPTESSIRSQSVPVPESFVDDINLPPTHLFEELTNEHNNPLFSSTSIHKQLPTSSTSSSNSSLMFESIDVGPEPTLNTERSSDVFFDSVFDLMMSDCQN